jgi:hypothetical protein
METSYTCHDAKKTGVMHLNRLCTTVIRLANYNAKCSHASNSDAVTVLGLHGGFNYFFLRLKELQSCKQYFAGLGKYLVFFLSPKLRFLLFTLILISHFLFCLHQLRSLHSFHWKPILHRFKNV